MKNLYSIQTEFGEVLIESNGPLGNASHRLPVTTRGEEKIIEIGNTLESALQNVERFYQSVAKVAQRLEPNEISLEIGVKMNVSTGMFVISAGTEVDFKLSLKWSKSKT